MDRSNPIRNTRSPLPPSSWLLFCFSPASSFVLSSFPPPDYGLIKLGSVMTVREFVDVPPHCPPCLLDIG